MSVSSVVAGSGLYLRQDRSDQQSTTREFAKDVQELSASSGSTSAGAVRQKSPMIESSCGDRREAQENRTDNVSSEAHGDVADDIADNAKSTAVQEYQVGAEEIDVADVSDQESEGLKRRGEQFLEVRKVLEIPMEDAKTIREREVGFGSRTKTFWSSVLCEQYATKAFDWIAVAD